MNTLMEEVARRYPAWSKPAARSVTCPDLRRQEHPIISTSPDPDGLLRSVPLLIKKGGEAFPSLALSVWLKAAGGTGQVTVREDAGAVWLQAGGKQIPAETDGQIASPSAGKGRTFPISADDVFGRVSPEHMKGKIVLVGTSAAGLKEPGRLRPTRYSRGWRSMRRSWTTSWLPTTLASR